MVPPQPTDQLAQATWRKSSRSPTQSECVEIAALPGRTAIRDSKNPDRGALLLTSQQISTLLTAAKAGQLDICQHRHPEGEAPTEPTTAGVL